MQELEKILEEIEDHVKKFVVYGTPYDYISFRWVKQIIRKHMNDGWIPVEERLPSGGMDVEVTVRRGYRIIGYYNEMYEEWYSTDESELIDVIAWKEPSEPYRERSEGE